MSLEPGFVERTDDCFRNLTNVIEGLWPPAETEAGRLYHIVSALTSSAQTNYLTLRKALDAADQTLSAWSCQNLLELSIFTQFVLKSKIMPINSRGID
jgi:hypothetical protein